MTDADYLAWLEKTSARRCVLVEVGVNLLGTGADTTMYLSNLSYVSDGSATPAQTAYVACINGGVRFESRLDLTGSGNASISNGDIEIDNTGGVRDLWLTYVWAGRPVKVYMGDAQWARSDFRLIFSGIVDDIDSRSAEVLNFRLRDKMELLNNPLTENKLGGTTDNKDRLIPICLGECFNVTPLLTDPALLKYRVHDTTFEGRIESIIETRSNGAVPVNTTNTVSTGTVTLNVAPAGTDITMSVQGGRDSSGAYSNDISSLVQRIATKYGPTAFRLTSGDLDAANLSAFATAHPDAVGIYADDRLNRIDACMQLASSVGAQAYFTTTGLLRLVQVTLPSSQTTVAGSAWIIGQEDISYHSLKIAERLPVQAAVKLGYCKNWTPQTNIAGGVNPASVPLFTEEWLTVTQQDATVAAMYNQTVLPEQVDTLLLVDTSATNEAIRRLALWKVQRYVYEMECRPGMLLAELGDPVTLTHPRFGLSAGVSGMIVSVARDWLKGRVTVGVLA